ncbi:MAG: hypothetical protein CVU71_01145 [Deltaproteobacteria bacterium HGW-Deltaproteobacteria-6]|nr:MAG: hypothetical protein CVU71_01145 [Deltaproteobacteria bacterium HGW-Deltaproteobacteria-6]
MRPLHNVISKESRFFGTTRNLKDPPLRFGTRISRFASIGSASRKGSTLTKFHFRTENLSAQSDDSNDKLGLNLQIVKIGMT